MPKERQKTNLVRLFQEFVFCDLLKIKFFIEDDGQHEKHLFAFMHNWTAQVYESELFGKLKKFV